jgi:type I restriction enzyme R subunit
MLVVDRLQLRDQLDSKMHNMNIQKAMFIEATDRKSFIDALSSDKRIVVVNLQKFGSVNTILDEAVVKNLANLRIAFFLIDEIHRSNSGAQHEEMLSVFDELQASFDNNEAYTKQHKKRI